MKDKFISYRSKSGKESGVTGYIGGEDRIVVKFRNREVYVYTYASAGKEAVEEMKRLAEQQLGLSTFISKNNPGWEQKVK